MTESTIKSVKSPERLLKSDATPIRPQSVDLGLTGFLAVVTAVHLAIYASTTGSPLDRAAPAWQGYWDQSQYLRSARALAEGNLSPQEHWYALGYPLLAVPFLDVLPKDPYFVVNLASLLSLPPHFFSISGPSSVRPRAWRLFSPRS